MITSSTGRPTSKTKTELGVPEESSVIWIPFDVNEEDRELLQNWNSQLCIEAEIGKSNKVIPDASYPLCDEAEYRKLHQRLRRGVHTWLASNRSTIIETAEKFATVMSKTPEQLMKELQATMARSAKLQEQLEKMQTSLKK